MYPHPIYYYLIRANSITTTVNSKKSYDLIQVAKNLHSFSMEHVDNYESKIVFSYYISMCINNSLSLAIGYDKNEKKQVNKLLKESCFLFGHLKQSPTIKNKVEGFLFSFFSTHCLEIYKLLMSFKK